MSFTEIEQQARALPGPQRAALVTALLDTFPPVGAEVSDEEAMQRDREMESGQVQPISHEEFVRRVERERGR
jgi:hypothetical protein